MHLFDTLIGRYRHRSARLLCSHCLQSSDSLCLSKYTKLINILPLIRLSGLQKHTANSSRSTDLCPRSPLESWAKHHSQPFPHLRPVLNGLAANINLAIHCKSSLHAEKYSELRNGVFQMSTVNVLNLRQCKQYSGLAGMPQTLQGPRSSTKGCSKQAAVRAKHRLSGPPLAPRGNGVQKTSR